MPRAYEEKGAYESQNEEKRGLRKPKMREKGLTKVKMKAIDHQKFFVPVKIQKVPRAYESLNPGLFTLLVKFNAF
jgi:hypothetical protein